MRTKIVYRDFSGSARCQRHTLLVFVDNELLSFGLLSFCLFFGQDAAARSLFSTKVDPSKSGDGFNMGDRDGILDAIEAGPILVHVALAEGRQFPYEAIMRSVFKHLMDSATSEYLFTIEFFKVCCTAAHGTDRYHTWHMVWVQRKGTLPVKNLWMCSSRIWCE